MTTTINGSSPSITFSDGSAQTSATRPFLNRIINGAMVLDQRNAGASVTFISGFTLDRWQGVEDTDGAMTAQQVTDAPAGFTNSLKVTTTTADASLGATQYADINQPIEGYNIADLGWGTADAKTITISFWVKSSLTGTFGGCLTNSAYNRSYPFTYTVSSANTWEQKSVTIAGDTSGTWQTTTSTGIRVIFGLGVGSTYSGTAGAWAGANYLSASGAVSVIGTLSATWQVTGVQLEVGSTATSFDYRPYGTELALCQRYFEQWNLANANYQYLSNGFSWSGNGVRTILQFMVQKRANPSSTVSGDLIFANSGKSATLSSGFAFDGAGLNSVLLYNDSSSGWTTGQAVQVSTSTSAKLTFSAEL